jgi:hypothetical protein
MFTVRISKSDLIDLLESQFGNVFERMSGEEDTIIKIQDGASVIEFTIGKDGE